MAIVSSAITVDSYAQRDGRWYVCEVHTDHVGMKYYIVYLGTGDFESALAARVSTLEAQLAEAEIASNIAEASSLGMFATIKLVHSTLAQSGARLREAYKTMIDRDAVMCGEYLSTLTNVQLQNIFGMTPAQVTNLRTNKLEPAAAQAAELRAATGA